MVFLLFQDNVLSHIALKQVFNQALLIHQHILCALRYIIELSQSVVGSRQSKHVAKFFGYIERSVSKYHCKISSCIWRYIYQNSCHNIPQFTQLYNFTLICYLMDFSPHQICSSKCCQDPACLLPPQWYFYTSFQLLEFVSTALCNRSRVIGPCRESSVFDFGTSQIFNQNLHKYLCTR